MDRKNNHTANKNKQSKYGKLYFIEHSSEYLSIWMKLHVLTIKLTHWAWATCGITDALWAKQGKCGIWHGVQDRGERKKMIKP